MQNLGNIEGRNVCISWHAATRMVEMKLSAEEIKEIIVNPDEIYESIQYQGSLYHRKGTYSFAIVYEGNCMTIITVVYSSLDHWVEALNDGVLSADRCEKTNARLARSRG